MEFHLLHTFSEESKVDYLDYFALVFTLIGFLIVNTQYICKRIISKKINKGKPKRVKYFPR